jgi:hypothetical protein
MRPIMSVAGKRIGLLVSLLLLLTLIVPTVVSAEPNFSQDQFKAKWQRADKPVNDATSNPARSWLWGPESFLPPGGATTEQYANSPGGNRQVLYFDKARMEINNPTSPSVTNGLLVRELITGKLATGDASNIDRQPAFDIPVAGDPSNNNGPTYASFKNLVTFNPGENASPNKTGQPVTDYVNKDGTVSQNPALGSVKYAYYNEDLKHNIPDVLWTFMNQRGNVYVNGQMQNDQPILGDNPLAPWLDATGFPISEPYWANVTLAGKDTLLLIQNFERRTLTYTPSNPAAFQVEMGNVGRHYHTWRYDTKYNAAPPTPQPTGCEALPASTGGAYPFLKCGPAGMVIGVIAPMGKQELVMIEVIKPNGTEASGVLLSQADGTLIAYLNSLRTDEGKWKITLTGMTSGKSAETYVWLEKPVETPTIIAFPNPARMDQDVTVIAIGFSPGEPVRVGVISPVAGAPFLYNVQYASDGGGTTSLLKLRTIFTGDKAKYLQPGNYVFRATNVSGSRQADKVLTITN